MCKTCKDGTPAIFTFAARDDAAAAANDGRPCVGADEKYVPLCRKHFNSAREPPFIVSPSLEHALNVHAC
jgi:thymidine kinase